MSAFLLKLW